jgi:membrane protease YdiL (CAAX protease family)
VNELPLLSDAVVDLTVSRSAGPGNVVRRLVAVIEVVAMSGFPTQLAIGAVLMGLGGHPYNADGGLSLSYVVAGWSLDAVVLVGLIAWRLRASGEPVGRVLFGARPLRREAAIGLVLVPVLFGLVAAVLGGLRLLIPSLHNVATNPFEGLIRSPLDAWILGAMAVVSGGVKEEVQRAFILHRFDQHLGGATLGLVVFSLAFGAGHFIQGWDVGVVTTLLGVFWGILYLRRHSVAASMISHSGFNVVQVLQYTILGA